MSEILKIFITAGLTVLSGTIIYVIGQVLSKFIIEPLHDQKRIIAEINDTLIFYANQFFIYRVANPKADEVSDKLRALSTQLRAKTNIIPFYKYFQKHKIVLVEKDIQDACTALIGLSNSVYVQEGQTVSHVESYRETVSNKLKIKI